MQDIYSANTQETKTCSTQLTQVAISGTALAGGGRVGVMGVIPVFVWLSKAGAALAGRGWCGNLFGMAIFALPKHKPQIHFGRQGGGTGQLPIPGTTGTDWYLAAGHRERDMPCLLMKMWKTCFIDHLITSVFFPLFVIYYNIFLTALRLFCILSLIRSTSVWRKLQNKSELKRMMIMGSIVEGSSVGRW